MKRLVLRHERNLLRERESALQGWERVELMTMMEWYVSGAKDLRFIGREFIKSVKRSCGMIDLQT